MAEMNQAQKDMKNFANNLKTTAQGIKFAKTLFTNPGSLSAKQITATLQALGLNIPPEVQATAEVAQIISTGQAVSDAIAAGRTIDDIKSVTNPSMAALRAVNQIASQNGWIDQDTASVVSYGTNIAMIVASAGANVAAWVGLALDIASTVSAKQAEADINALKDAQGQFQRLMNGQVKALSETFTDFQNGKIGIYGVIAKLAVESPALWPQVMKEGSPFLQMFPDLQMLPVVEQTIWGYGESAIKGDYPWPASGSYIIESWNSWKSIKYKSIGQMTKEEAAEYFFTVLIKPWVTCYAIANNEVVSRGNMSMENVAALSFMVNPSGEISASADYVNMLLGTNLTPYDLGDDRFNDVADQFVRDAYKGVDTSFKESAVSFGTSKLNIGFSMQERDREIMREKLERVQKTASIWELAQNPYIYERLRSYMDFETVSFEKDPSFGGKINAHFSENQVTAWRKLHNYIATLQLLDSFRKDPYLATTRYAQEIMPFMPSVDTFDAKVKKISYLSTMRSINILAQKKIAEFLGVKPSQLQKATPDGYIGAAVYK